MEVIFAYGYECCVFEHNICGDSPEVLKGMSDSAELLPSEFFVNLGCPPVHVTVGVTTIEVLLKETVKEPMEIAVAKDHSRLQFLSLCSYLITTFCKGALAGRHHLCTLRALVLFYYCLFLIFDALIISRFLKPLIHFLMQPIPLSSWLGWSL